MDRQKLSITEPRAEWPDEIEARVASILHQEDCPCTSPVHEADYLDTARIVLSSIEAVPRAERERALYSARRDAAPIALARAEQAESQLAALQARCEGVAKEIRDAIDSGSVDLNDLYALAGHLGGPDDAPKEPTPCKTCGGTGTAVEYAGGYQDVEFPCPDCSGSLPERDETR